VFNIDIETCSECGVTVKVIACLEYPAVINNILTHLNEKAASMESIQLPQRPPARLFDEEKASLKTTGKVAE